MSLHEKEVRMQLSQPIYVLKRRAKELAKQSAVPLTSAQNQIAAAEGFKSWSHLAALHSAQEARPNLMEMLVPGTLSLLAGRPGHGKTLAAVELVCSHASRGVEAWLFSLELTEDQAQQRCRTNSTNDNLIRIDCSNEICAAYMMDRLRSAACGSVVVVDYLQLLDQRRENPSLQEQVTALRAFVDERGLRVVCLSQIDRGYQSSGRDRPGMQDIRLPNPVDLRLFDHVFVIHDGALTLAALP